MGFLSLTLFQVCWLFASKPGTAGLRVLTFQPGLPGVLAEAAPLQGPDSVPGQANPVSGSSRKLQLGLGAKGDA